MIPVILAEKVAQKEARERPPSGRSLNSFRSPDNQESLKVMEFLFSGSDADDTSADLEDGKLTRSYFDRMKMLEYGNLVFSLTSLGLSMLQYTLEFEERNEAYSYVLLSIVFACTILLVVFTIIRYQMQIKFNKLRKIITKRESIWSTGMWKAMLSEIIMVSFHPSPFLVGYTVTWKNGFLQEDIYYHINEFFHLLILLRVIVVARVILVSTMWISNRSIRVCNMYGTEATYLFAIRCLMKTQSFALVFTLLGLCLFFFGFALRICEAPLNRLGGENFDLYSLTNSIWCMVLTMTTVGYGDFYPRTVMGRIVVFISSVSGMSIVSMMVVTITNSLQLSTLEERALTVLSKLQLKEEIRSSAAKMLTSLVKASTHFKKTKKLMKGMALCVKKEAKLFAQKTRTYKSFYDNTNLSEELSTHFLFMMDELKKIDSKQDKLNAMLERVLGEKDQS